MRARLRSWRPVRFFPDPAVSQQLIPLFELLSVRDICALACVSSGWSAALDAKHCVMSGTAAQCHSRLFSDIFMM
mgnify:CR=1 FL=1